MRGEAQAIIVHMQWEDVEKSFDRALLFSVSRKKLIVTFVALLLCGLFIVFCKALALSASPWIALSLGFLPIFLSSGVLLALGVVLSRIYVRETKQISVDLKKLMSSSLDLIIGISYLSLPPLFAYLTLWIVLGVFFLLREVPGIGEFFSVILSFGPFLLIFGSLLLCLFNLMLLFFVAPAATLQSMRKGALAKRVFGSLANQLFSSILMFLIGVLPLLFMGGFLYLAAHLTNTSFSFSDKALGVAMEWFFIMIPFAALLSPAVVFFFNFSTESYALLQSPQTARS
jgi:hypothetical protein